MRRSRPRYADVLLIEPKVFGESAAFFSRASTSSASPSRPDASKFVQDNHSRSVKHVLRGLHYQISKPQGKLVRVVAGEVFDVAVDIRRSSPTFGQVGRRELSADNKKQLWIPAGFAHGFLVLTDAAEFLYKTTDYYGPEDERCLLWNDPDLAIAWPKGVEPILSAKDRLGLGLSKAEVFA